MTVQTNHEPVGRVQYFDYVYMVSIKFSPRSLIQHTSTPIRLHELAVLDNVQVNILINSHVLKLSTIITQVNKLLDLGLREMWAQVTLVLLEDDWLSLLTSDSVSERSLNNDFLEHGAVVETDGQGVRDGAEVLVVVVLGELWVLHTLNLLPQALHKRRSSGLASIGVISSLQAAINQHNGSHVLNTMIAIRKVIHGLKLLINDANTSLMGTASDVLDIRRALAHSSKLVVDVLSRLDSGLRVELGGVGHLEQHVLHHVAAVPALELERFALEEHVVEAPDWGGEDRWNAWLAGLDLQGKVDGALAGVACGPGLARHGVWAVAVGAEGLAVNPGLGNGRLGLLLGQTEHLGDDGGGGDLDEDDVVETDLVVGVQECQATLDLMCLDHGLEDILDGQDLAVTDVAACAIGAGDPVGDGENGTQVIRWMTPLGCEPAVVVIQPSDHSTNVEGGVDWVELEVGSWDLWAIWNNGPWNGWAEQLGALLEAETLETAAKGVEEDEAGGVELGTC